MTGLPWPRIPADTSGEGEVVICELEILGSFLVSDCCRFAWQVEIFVRLQGMVQIRHAAEIVAQGHVGPGTYEISLSDQILDVFPGPVLDHVNLLQAHVGDADAPEHGLEDRHSVIYECVVLSKDSQFDSL